MKAPLLNLAVIGFVLLPSGIRAAGVIGTIDAGGQRTATASCTNDGSIGAIGSLAADASLTQIVKPGYVGQLFEATNLVVTASPSPVPEETTSQLGGQAWLDDGTMAIIHGSDMTWASPVFPLASISPAGVALAAAVYADTPATVAGGYLGLQNSASLLVKNTDPDNFGAYAHDGLPDSWQIQYFGLPPNPNAGPEADPFHTGQNNLFKYIAGLDPTNPASLFTLRVQMAAQPGQTQLVFSPRWPDRTYTVTWTANLSSGVWALLTGAASSDNGVERTITDLHASGNARFYRIQISKP
jgi:hypothetical protein